MSNQRRFALLGAIESAFAAQVIADTIGALLVDSSEIDFTYNGTTPSITAALKATLPEAHAFTGINSFNKAFSISTDVTAATFTVENATTGDILIRGGTASVTSDGGTVSLIAGAGGFNSGAGGIAIVRGGATGDSPAGRAAMEGGHAFGTGAGGDVGFQGGQSDGGQGGHGTFYSGSGASHVGDLYFGLGQNGAYIALRIVGDTHAWEVNGSAGTASQSILQSGGSAGAPSWLTAGANDRILRRTSDTLNFGQLTAGMFPNTVVPDAALSSNVPLLNRDNQEFTGAPLFGLTATELAGTSGLDLATATAFFDDNVVQARIGASPTYRLVRVNTSYTVPSAVLSGQSIALFQFSGYNSSTIATGGQLASRATEDWSSGARGCDFVFQTTQTGSNTIATRLLVAANATGSFAQVPDGAVSQPAWSFLSDTDTGLYRIGADNLGIATGGTLRGDVDATRWLFALPVFTPASIAGAAGLRLPHGTAPTSPVDGDMWTTTAGLFVRINGVTVGPLS